MRAQRCGTVLTLSYMAEGRFQRHNQSSYMARSTIVLVFKREQYGRPSYLSNLLCAVNLFVPDPVYQVARSIKIAVPLTSQSLWSVDTFVM